MEYRASHRYADVTARKIRPFATLIRKKSAAEAVELLKYIPNRGAKLLNNVVKSAIANARDLGASDPEGLIVSVARVDDGPTFKRMMPRARGTAYMILRRLSHIHVSLQEEMDTKPELTPVNPAAAVPATSPAATPAPAPAPATNPTTGTTTEN